MKVLYILNRLLRYYRNVKKTQLV